LKHAVNAVLLKGGNYVRAFIGFNSLTKASNLEKSSLQIYIHCNFYQIDGSLYPEAYPIKILKFLL